MSLFHYFRDKSRVFTLYLSRLYSLYSLRFSSFCQFSAKRSFWPLISAFCLVMSVAAVWLAPLLLWGGFFIFLNAGDKCLKAKRSFWPGFYWCAAWCGGVLLFPLYALVGIVGNVPCGFALLLCGIGMAGYAGFLGGVMLWMRAWLSVALKRGSVGCLVSEFIMLLLFFRFFLYDALRVFDLGEGFFFLHPLAPLMESPLWRMLVVWGGEWGAICLLLLTLFGVRFLFERKRYFLCGLSIFMLVVPGNWRAVAECPFFQTQGDFVCLPSRAFTPCGDLHAADAAGLLARSLEAVPGAHYGKVQTVIFPESAFPIEIALGTPAFQALEGLSLGRRLLCGCYWRSNQGVSNAAAFFVNGSFKGVYCKQHGVPFAERLPIWCTWPFMQRLLSPLLGGDVFVQGCEQAPGFECEEMCLVPMLCSELFSRPIALDASSSCVVVAGMINDAWWVGTSFPYHLWRIAAFRALAGARPFLYVSYTRQGFFDGRGGWLKLVLTYNN
ncbi:TPA: hypothetical protein DEG75_04590 [Candidatus Dependentiae bacterium]|nr:hypothetical protein [Candidatus Dependentiae bacterium]